ncbi:MAG: hypothetical protein LBE44_02060 [Microbacterium hominis]|jgi:hypothetical protein|nr:hypothetical protein [Microbacterium hominis]
MIRQASSDWSLPSSSLAGSDDLTVCVRRFGVPDPKEPWKGDLTKQIVSARLSPDRPRDLLVSYSDDALYLFDTDAETFVRLRKPRHPREDEMWRGGEQSEGDEIDSPGGGRSDEEDEDDESQEMEEAEAETENGANARAEHEEKGDPPTGRETSVGDDDEEMSEEGEDDDDDDDEEEEEDLPFDPFVKPARLAPHSEIPMVAPWRRYDGHANSQVIRHIRSVSKARAILTAYSGLHRRSRTATLSFPIRLSLVATTAIGLPGTERPPRSSASSTATRA